MFGRRRYPVPINLGIAIDLTKEDGSRQLLVPSIKGCEELDFAQFWASYEETVRKARAGSLTVEDFAGTSVSLTNPGTIGTVHSVPRLVQGQGLILGVGAMDYPAEFQGASEETLADLAISKVITLTSTYDHRIIQGAQSGDFLRRIHEILLGADGFYDEIFAALRIPYVPIRWVVDIQHRKNDEIDKTARVQQLIHSYRTLGHLMADVDPLQYKQRQHPDLDVVTHGLTLWDLEREFATGGFGGKSFMKLRKILGILRDSYCRHIGVEYMYIENPEERAWIQEHVESGATKTEREEQLRILYKLNSAEAFESFLHTKFVGQKRFSLEGGESSWTPPAPTNRQPLRHATMHGLAGTPTRWWAVATGRGASGTSVSACSWAHPSARARSSIGCGPLSVSTGSAPCSTSTSTATVSAGTIPARFSTAPTP